MDSRDSDFETRTDELWIENEENINVTPHGIVEYRGRVYWVELTGDHFGELDPATGEMKRYPMPTKGAGPHSVWVDSRGSFWYTYFASAGRIGRFDLAAEDFTEWEPLSGFSGYGIVVDRQDRVWAVGLHTPAIFMYNQETAAWRSYPLANPARRPAIDSDGKIWAAHYFGNAISKIDPVTSAVTEYVLPLKDGNPYDVWPDDDDNLWVENGIYNSLVRFDQQTNEFTYFPFPELRAHTPKLDRDAQGPLWFTLRGPSGPGVAALKPHGVSRTTAEILALFADGEPKAQTAHGYREYRHVLRDVMALIGVELGIEFSESELGCLADSLPNWPVFPDADVKIYLDAAPTERAARRAADPAHGLGRSASTLSDVASALAARDRSDRTRDSSPLVMADDAVRVKDEIPDAAIVKGRVSDFVVMGEVLDAQTFFPGIAEGHAEHTKMVDAITYIVTDNIKQLLPKSAHAVRLGIAPQPVDCEADQADVIVMDLQDAIAGGAMHHRL